MNEQIAQKKKLDHLLLKHQVQPVGAGYIDCIALRSDAKNLIAELSQINILVEGLTWWCHCQNEETGCPHGMGGPQSRYHTGWFSEMDGPFVSFGSNEQVLEYLADSEDRNRDRLDCLVPGLWLKVPATWSHEL